MLNENILNQNIDNEDNDEIEIDPSELIIIADSHNWKPPKELILAYANQLGFDIESDPPEMLSIAEKYLTKDIPNEYCRAFYKKTLQLVYINQITKEIELNSEFEELAKEEYKVAKEKFLKEKKNKEFVANKAKVIPNKKIAPIGSKKTMEDPIKKREKEFMKEVKKNYKFEKKEEFQDEETRQLQKMLKKEAENKNIINNNDNDDLEEIKNKYKYSEDENDENNDKDNYFSDDNYKNRQKVKKDEEDVDYDKKHEINDKEKKFPSKNIMQNNDNDNNIMVLNLNDSNENKNYNDSNDNHSEENSSSEDGPYRRPISSKKNIINKIQQEKEKGEEEIKIIHNDNNDNNVYGENESPRFQRSNKRRQNLTKDYKYDKKLIEEINQEKSFKKEKSDSDYNNNSNDSNNNKNNYKRKINIKTYNNNEKSNVNDIEDEIDLSDLKSKYLTKIKQNFKNYKNDIKNNYKQNKNNFIENYIHNLSSIKSKDMMKNINEIKRGEELNLIEYEKELQNQMNKNLEKYKKELINEYEDNLTDIINNNVVDRNGDIDSKKNLELKIKKLESDIRIQKERNKNKKELNEKKVNNKILISKQNIDNKTINQKLDLDRQSQKDINDLNKELQLNYESFIKECKEKNNLANNISVEINNNSIKNTLKEDLILYENELKKNLEQQKLQLQEKFNKKFEKEIENLKINIYNEDMNDKKRINDQNKEIETDFYNELNELKISNRERQKKLDNIIKNIIEKTSSLYTQIKNKEINDINTLMTEIIQNIIKINSENNKEKDIFIDDYISEIMSGKKLLLNKYVSYVDMAEDEFKQNNILAQYFTDIIKIIISLLRDNTDNNNELINDEAISNIYNIINNYRSKYENEKNIKFYPFLNDALQKIMDLIFNEDNTNHIINNSIYGKSFINNNINTTNRNINPNINNINNNASVLNESLNNNLKSIRTINSSNNPNMNINDTNKSIEDLSLNNNNLYHNQSLYNTQRANQSQNIFHNNQNNNLFLNKTFSSTYRPNRYSNINNKLNNNIVPINEQEEINCEINLSLSNVNNINNIIIPRLPSDVVNIFNIECQNKYKIIINFLIEESNNIIKEQNNYYNKKNANNKLTILKESGEFPQYNGILEQISRQEDNKVNQYLKDIQSKSNIFDMIKNNCEENFNFILNYPDRSNIVSNKLNVLVKHIDEYKKHYNSKIYIDKKFDINSNIENILNNTFTIEQRNYNNNESILNNISYLDRTNNRFYNTASKSSNFNSKFFNTFNHL